MYLTLAQNKATDKFKEESKFQIYDPRNLSTLVLADLERNFMQIGGLTPTKAKIELGNVHIPSPHIKPDATAGPNASALVLFNFCHTNNIRLPRLISIAKYGPI